jgi:hypothetical protein
MVSLQIEVYEGCGIHTQTEKLRSLENANSKSK